MDLMHVEIPEDLADAIAVELGGGGVGIAVEGEAVDPVHGEDAA
jgi:hypothetical protein